MVVKGTGQQLLRLPYTIRLEHLDKGGFMVSVSQTSNTASGYICVNYRLTIDQKLCVEWWSTNTRWHIDVHHVKTAQSRSVKVNIIRIWEWDIYGLIGWAFMA